MKRDIAETCTTAIAAVLRDKAMSPEDRVQRIQDIIERGLEKYGAAAAQRVRTESKEAA